MKDRKPDLLALDLVALCKDAAHLKGEWPLAGMSRLMTSLAAVPDGDMAWSLQASQKPEAGAEPQRWLHLQGRARVPLVCQRCLGVMVELLQIDQRLRFVRSEDEAARLDEESDEDVLSLPARLDLAALCEDELILALPLVPKHDPHCPQPLPMPAPGFAPALGAPGPKEASTRLGAGDETKADGERPHPFAALAALRKPPGKVS
jgi:uncharacterized protein